MCHIWVEDIGLWPKSIVNFHPDNHTFVWIETALTLEIDLKYARYINHLILTRQQIKGIIVDLIEIAKL